MKFVRARASIGRRGAILLSFAILWITEGVGQILPHQTTHGGVFLTVHVPWWLRAAGWIITGCVAAVYAVRRQGRDWPGWVALYVMAAFVVAVLLDELLETMIAGGNVLPVILSMLANGALLAVIGIASGWREPVTIHHKDTL